MATFVIPCNPVISHLKTLSLSEQIIQTTKETLMKAIEAALASEDKHMHCMFEGDYKNKRIRPTLSYWEQCNPAITRAVREICAELAEKGWSPHVEIGRSVRDQHTGIYNGGRKLNVGCDFIS